MKARGLGPVYMEMGDLGNPLRLGNPPVRNIMTLILVWSRLHDRWGHPQNNLCQISLQKYHYHYPLHVTSPTWGPPPPCKQALRLISKQLCTCITLFCPFLFYHRTTTTGENCHHFTNWSGWISAIVFEAACIHFLSDVFVAVAVVVA